MYRYVTDVSKLSHHIVKNFCINFNIAVDATLGNGYDSDFLSENFTKVYAFDIQKCAVDGYKEKNIGNVCLINDSHENFSKYINEKVDCIMYNLGFLPGGDKKVTTRWESTLKSLEDGLNIIDRGALVSIALYRGHEEGKKEEEVVINYVKNLPKNKYGVMIHSFVNRDNNPPILIIIEKK